MDLPNLLNKIKTSPNIGKNFLAIEIAANNIKTAVWQATGDATEIQSLGSIQAWDGVSSEDLLLAIDTSLSEALAGIENEPNEVIFGLPESWVSQDGITETQKLVIHDICHKLAIKPVGFVVTTEAIVHHLQEKEGGPPSVILIQLSQEDIVVSLVRQGVLNGTHEVGRSDRITSDVQEGLARFKDIKQLPSRILLYNSKEDLEAIKQELIAFDWPDTLPFLHLPQIDILDKFGTIEAVALSGGLEVARSLGITENPKTDTNQPTNPIAPPTPTPSSPPDEVLAPTTLPFGFTPLHTTGTESQMAASKIATVPSKKENSESIEPANLLESDVIPVDGKEVFSHQSNETEEPEKTNPKHGKFKISLSKLPRLPLPKLSKRRFGIHPIILIGVIGLLLLSISGFIYYWTVPQAEITIYVKPEVLDKQITFTLDPQLESPDITNQKIPAISETVELNGAKTAATTGTLTVGERAKGTIELFNRTLSSKAFEAGTSITIDQFRFTLDDPITIASASSQENDDFSLTVKPSSESVTATAIAIGDQYNVPQNTQFTVENYATEDYLARATTSFSGGNSRDVQVVSEDDLIKLEQDLIADLTQQLNQQVESDTQNQQATIPLEEPEIITATYSHDVDDETDSVSLEASMNQVIYKYNTADLNALAQAQVLNDIPDNFQLIPDATQVQVTDSTISSSGVATVSAATRIYLIPTIDTAEIIKNITGKYPPDTESTFKSIPNYVKAEMTITPKLPARLNTFPRKTEKIIITVKPAGL